MTSNNKFKYSNEQLKNMVLTFNNLRDWDNDIYRTIFEIYDADWIRRIVEQLRGENDKNYSLTDIIDTLNEWNEKHEIPDGFTLDYLLDTATSEIIRLMDDLESQIIDSNYDFESI